MLEKGAELLAPAGPISMTSSPVLLYEALVTEHLLHSGAWTGPWFPDLMEQWVQMERGTSPSHLRTAHTSCCHASAPFLVPMTLYP